ncbi:mandelate racemase/muconate lactonizing enzyme family protein [Neolewinella agarilytica]|uniref:D-galactarolactone cycloisomerase n=1 Tax=Neolewinella agarilytica TaxID=478744 RepID=A0A1H9KNA6_9BACT|nr:mandelate racemase/muconate lactonizing enzyme family protein [Neolewinella agarilytica]SER00333.1 D-galactarolactone cycloisomerase [Neolewinella agarilytica]
MKIAKIETYLLSDQLEESFFFSQWAYSERRICIVKVSTECGIIGWGEGYGPADVLEAGIKLLQPMLIGKNPLEQEAIWFDLYRKTLDYARRGILVASISAIDLALWDIKGKTFGQPVSVLLGGRHRKQILPYATGLYFSQGENLASRLAQEAVSYIEQGFRAIKMKVGFTPEQDLINVREVRKAIGPDTKLMVDANHAYSLREATELCRKIEPYDIGWFEEPISPEFHQQYQQLRTKTSIPIAGGECEYLRYGHHELLKNNSVDILQIDICSAGGLTEAKRIAALASTYGVEIIPHTWGTGIAFHAALHFIANLEPVPGRLFPPDFYIEYDRTSNGIRDKLTSPCICMKDGYIDVPSRPGLGFEVDEDVLAYYSLPAQNGKKVS